MQKSITFCLNTVEYRCTWEHIDIICNELLHARIDNFSTNMNEDI